jgi:hypothetical protein
MSFEERLALLVDREVHWRNDKRQARLLKLARLKYPQAAIEDIDSRAGRGIQRSSVMSLALGEWVQSGHAVLITGPTWAGKSWLACALAQHACRRGFSAHYQRVPRLGETWARRAGMPCCSPQAVPIARTFHKASSAPPAWSALANASWARRRCTLMSINQVPTS